MDKKQLLLEAEELVLNELKKVKMKRSDVVRTVEPKYGNQIAQKLGDDVSWYDFQKKHNIQIEKYKNSVKIDLDKAYPHYFIGENAKEPKLYK
jgi:hypothetical protein